jgi:hypothetical protein
MYLLAFLYFRISLRKAFLNKNMLREERLRL